MAICWMLSRFEATVSTSAAARMHVLEAANAEHVGKMKLVLLGKHAARIKHNGCWSGSGAESCWAKCQVTYLN